MSTTIHTISDSQIQQLHEEAVDARDWVQVAICEIALGTELHGYGELDPQRDYEPDEHEAEAVRMCPDQESARAECARVITAAEDRVIEMAMEDETMSKVTYHANGSVCGSCGHNHKTPEAAHRCAIRHAKAIRKEYPKTFPEQLYSDRTVERTDGEPLTDEEVERICRL